MWRINKIDITNFKFFHETFPLKVDGKNLLLYGENGSGKSSIYWSFYTFLQSCYKEPTEEEARKYFLHDKAENLRNRFAKDNESSGLIVEFVNVNDGRKQVYEVSDTVCNTHHAGDLFVLTSTNASDFMNYKYLSSIFDFKNSKKPELFSLFLEDVFPSLLFGTADFIHIDGSSPTEAKSAEYWWKYIASANRKLPRGVNKKYILRTSDEHSNFEALRRAFDNRLEAYLTRIATNTNMKLKNDFKMDAEIEIDYKKTEKQRREIPTEEDGDLIIKPPRIYLTAKMKHSRLDANHSKVEHPRSFFNEAKLTCMAIALRLSIAEDAYRAVNDGVSALFVDDLLVSLDMANRIPVTNILLDMANRFQLFIFTHDKQFFSIVQELIKSRGEKDKWLWRELYSIVPELSEEPKPLLLENETPYQKALSYVSRCDYAAAANALRRQCEEEIRRICLYNDTHTLNATQCEPTKYMMLGCLIDELKKTYDKLHIPQADLNVVKLNLYRELLMNPLSHHDARSKIYKAEVVDIFDEVKKLMAVKVTDLCTLEDCVEGHEYQITVTNGTQSKYIKFKFCDIFRILTVNGVEYKEKTKIVINATDIVELRDLTKKYELTSLYPKICNMIWPANPAVHPNIKEVLVRL